MDTVSALLFFTAPLSWALALLILRVLGKRMGRALGLRSYHIVYVLSSIFLIVVTIAAFAVFMLIDSPSDLSYRSNLLLRIFVIQLPMLLALVAGLSVTHKYWSWIWDALSGSVQDEDGYPERRF